MVYMPAGRRRTLDRLDELSWDGVVMNATGRAVRGRAAQGPGRHDRTWTTDPPWLLLAKVWFVAAMVYAAYEILVSRLGVPTWWEAIQVSTWLLIGYVGLRRWPRAHVVQAVFLLLAPLIFIPILQYGYTLPSEA